MIQASFQRLDEPGAGPRWQSASNASTGKEMLGPAHGMVLSCQLKYGKAQFHGNKRALGRRSRAAASVSVLSQGRARQTAGSARPSHRPVLCRGQGGGHSCLETGSHCVTLTGLEFST